LLTEQVPEEGSDRPDQFTEKFVGGFGLGAATTFTTTGVGSLVEP
jgi:hypothetical protein